MSTYRPHHDLQMSAEEHAGLIALLAEFRGESAPEPVSMEEFRGLGAHALTLSTLPQVLETRLGFNMNFGVGLPTDALPVRGRYECGTAACIGGHLSLKMQGVDTTQGRFTVEQLKAADAYVTQYGWGLTPLDNLFYPQGLRMGAYERITPEMAAQAIENVLVDGMPDWSSIFTEQGLERFVEPDAPNDD